MSRIKYGNGEYHRIGYSNKTYRKIAFGTGPIRTLISYTSTWYNISSSQYGTRDSKYYVRSDAFAKQAASSANNWTYSYSNSYTTEKRSSYVSSLAFTNTASYAYASNANSTSSYSNSYVKTFYRYTFSGSSYNTTTLYTGTYRTSVAGQGIVNSGYTSSSKSYYTVVSPAANVTVTYNINSYSSNRTYVSSREHTDSSAGTLDNYSADLYYTAYTRRVDNVKRSSYNISSSLYRSSQWTYYNITRSSYANRNSQYLVASGVLTSAASKANNATYSYSNSYATKTY